MRMIRRLALASVLAAAAMAVNADIQWTTSLPVGPPGHTVEVSSQPAVTKNLLVVNAIYKDTKTGKPAYSITCASPMRGSMRGTMLCPAREAVNSSSPDSYQYAPVIAKLPDPVGGQIIYSYSGSMTVPSGSVVPPVADLREGAQPDEVNPGKQPYKSIVASWWLQAQNDAPDYGSIPVISQQIVSLDSVNATNTIVYRSLYTDAGPKNAIVLELTQPSKPQIIVSKTFDVYNLDMWTKGSARVRSYEEVVFHMQQGEIGGNWAAHFLAMDPKNKLTITKSADIMKNCGMTPQHGFIEWDIIKYDVFTESSPPIDLNAFMFWGFDKNAQVVVCRVSHNSFSKKWATTMPNMASVSSISGGNGYIVVSGPAKKAGKAVINVVDNTGTGVFFKERSRSNDVSDPTVHNQAVFYGVTGGIVGADLANGNEFFYKPISCRLQPIVTDKRLFCVTSSNTLVAYSIRMEQSLWSVEKVSAQFPPVLDPTTVETSVIVVRTDGTISSIGDLFVRPQTEPPADHDDGSSKGHAAGIALGIIMSLLVVAGVTAGAIYYFKRVRPQSRNALPEDEIGSTGTTPAPTPKSGLYGAVNE